MKKILIMMLLAIMLVGCSANKKPPLSETQVVNGKSIIIPPEFDTLPEVTKEKEK